MARRGSAAGASGTGGRGGAAGSSAGTTGTAGTTGAAGRGGTGGSGGTGGTGGQSSATVCQFSNGLNIAWVSFAYDVPNPNTNTFRTIFQNTYNAGGRTIRWWFHTNGLATPGYDGSGMPLALQQSHTDGVKAILSTAASVGVRIVISLWSFDMLQPNATDSSHPNNISYNKALLENDANRQAYVDKYLTPLVTALKGTPGLYAYEIFNEPEGMSPKGWTPTKTTQAAIQKTVNWFAAAIHTADPAALVTSSSQTFDYCSTVSGKSNWYSDSALRTAGGKQNGTLDFYEVHYYDANESQASGTALSPFGHPASLLGPGQEAGDRGILRGHDGRRRRRTICTRTSTPTGTTAHGRGSTTTAATRRRARRSSGRRWRRRSRTSTTRIRPR